MLQWWILWHVNYLNNAFFKKDNMDVFLFETPFFLPYGT